MRQRKLWAVPCTHLDRIVLDRLFDLIRHDSDMVERIKSFWESRKTEEVDEGQVLKHQIKKAEEQEDMIMRRCYPDAPQVELMKELPHRAWYRICDQAQVLNLRRSLPHQGRARVNVYHRTMRFDDLEAVAHPGQGPEEKERLCQIANELAVRTMRGNLTAYWWLSLDSVSFSGIDEVSAGEDEKFYVNALACVKHHPA